jgi:hypothetical protein
VTFRLRQVGGDWKPGQIGSIHCGEDILAGKIRRAVDLGAAIAERGGGAERPTTAAEAYRGRTRRDGTARRAHLTRTFTARPAEADRLDTQPTRDRNRQSPTPDPHPAT